MRGERDDGLGDGGGALLLRDEDVAWRRGPLEAEEGGCRRLNVGWLEAWREFGYVSDVEGASSGGEIARLGWGGAEPPGQCTAVPRRPHGHRMYICRCVREPFYQRSNLSCAWGVGCELVSAMDALDVCSVGTCLWSRGVKESRRSVECVKSESDAATTATPSHASGAARRTDEVQVQAGGGRA